MRRRNAVRAAALLGLTAACSPAEDPETQVAATESAVCTVEKVAQSPAEAELSNVYGLDVDSRGRIYAIAAPGIAVFSPEGGLLRRIGKAGSGPGEFRHLINLQVLPGDSLLAFDSELNRVTVFEPESDAVAYTVTAASLKSPPKRLWALPQERTLFAVHQRTADARGGMRGTRSSAS